MSRLLWKNLIEQVTDVDRNRRLWWVWPVITVGWLGVHHYLLSATASEFLLVVMGTALSGRWAGLTTAGVISVYAGYLYGADSLHTVEVAATLFLTPPLIIWLRGLARQGREFVNELNGNLVKLRGALGIIDDLLTNRHDLSDEDITDRLYLARDKIANLLTVAGLWVEYSRQRDRDIDRQHIEGVVRLFLLEMDDILPYLRRAVKRLEDDAE